MKLAVPEAGHYGALITNDSFEVLMRKDVNYSEGLFLRWKHNSDYSPSKFVRYLLCEDFCISAEFIKIPVHLIFFKGGTLVNFLMKYSGGDIEAAGFKWVSIREAWDEVAKLDSDEVRIGECSSLSILNDWIHHQRRKVAEKEIKESQMESYGAFDALCHRARAALDMYPGYFDGVGMYSEFMQSMIEAAAGEIDRVDNFSLYLDDLCSKAEKPGRSYLREKDLITIVRFSLASAYRRLCEEKHDDFSAECLRAEKFIAFLEQIYAEVSPELRARAIKGGGASRRGHVKSDEIKKVESVILKVLENKKLYGKHDQQYEIARKITENVLSEISSLGIGDIFSLGDLRQFIWDFLIENKAARALLK
ncbi:hypothetical protein [Pseudomonas turukhanskensis]|uniref:Uncharacterized protein n=1 Tax=Pseudomonas turukhanskensis TaxID=1806536 RepID=A0A9W6KA00_9PSED|nr:hypothetical protein [Pseudomonas turukhanskensis]GLK92191.1 hypothetical protein GCM10017655_52560 [Pseudomonas turukhanskensis]